MKKCKANSIEKLVEEGLVKKGCELKFTKPNKKSYDGEKLSFTVKDEIGQFPPLTLEEEAEMWRKFRNTPIQFGSPKKWIKQIEDYCSNVGILPEDLIKTHREANKGLKSKTKTLQQGIQEIEAIKPIGGKKDHSNWNENYRNKKLGL